MFLLILIVYNINVIVIVIYIPQLWNVNELQSSSNYKELMDLIDTLWNVNVFLHR